MEIGGDPSSELAVVGPAFPIIANGTPLYGGTKTFDVSSKGVLGGGQFGYNWQASTNAVLGFEADIQGSNIKGNGNCIVTCGAGVVTVLSLSAFPVVFSSDNVSHDIDWFGTVRGRLGYAAGPSLFYVTGGLAYGDVKRTGNVVGITTTLGGGHVQQLRRVATPQYGQDCWTTSAAVCESKIASNWSVKAEYLYVDLGSTWDSFNTVYERGAFPACRDSGNTDRYGQLSRPYRPCRPELSVQCAGHRKVLSDLKHSPEKWEPVFRKDHAQTKG